ncbi:carbonic anhydrase [Brumimicrobium salinarum]|uniref:Carbonic anhydrase n=1 Tax=Brumimicrobium salinarum TaxID=2058658 RepID=A0A2I0R6M7_9FLAO|nr:carbonic anhydrase family protein [Brumimicrobium salinarum]PKR82224.1 carbonic anhydrase [Brumimicrobium salinarum]
MDTQTREKQYQLTPREIKQLLIEGNQRFASGEMMERDLLEQVKQTSVGQFPHTIVLGCIDSRATTEQIFDQGIGDVFNARIAGNVVNKDVLGSIEFACKVAGSKLVLVLGHTKCGAVTSACNGVKLGHITHLLGKIDPAIEKVKQKFDDVTTPAAVNLVSQENVLNSIQEIKEKSPILKGLEENGRIKIIGGMYDVETGLVEFL